MKTDTAPSHNQLLSELLNLAKKYPHLSVKIDNHLNWATIHIG